MNKFSLPDAAFNVLHKFSKNDNLRDKGNYRFDGVTMARDNKTAPKFNYNAPSKARAKKDKVAIRYARTHGVKFALAPDMAMRTAGHVNRFSGKVESTRQF